MGRNSSVLAKVCQAPIDEAALAARVPTPAFMREIRRISTPKTGLATVTGGAYFKVTTCKKPVSWIQAHLKQR